MFEIIPNWHPFLVHFTLALYLSAGLFFVIAKVLPGAAWSAGMTRAALWNLWLGAAVTVMTYLAGRHAFGSVTHDDTSHAAMVMHAQWGTLTTVAFLVLAIWSVIAKRKGRPVGWLFTGLIVLASAALLNTGYKGADLVYRYGLGVMSLPKEADHSHARGVAAHEHETEGHKHGDGAAGHDHEPDPAPEHDHSEGDDHSH
ncbi:MAG: DUF2231 domain-containing protein [Sphingomonadales bacterium]